MATNTVTNWFGNIVSHPRVIVDADSVADIVAVLKDSEKYPAPVRAVGSNHSTAPCGVAEGGTLIRMKMDKILSIGQDRLIVEAGAVHLKMAKSLEAKKMQFYVRCRIMPHCILKNFSALARQVIKSKYLILRESRLVKTHSLFQLLLSLYRKFLE